MKICTARPTTNMIIKSYIRLSDPAQAWIPLLSLPIGLRPHSFSSGESPDKTEGSVGDKVAIDSFIQDNRFGFFLFADRARYNIVSRKNESYCTVSADPLADNFEEADVLAIFRALARTDLIFAFAADISEYHHRNKYLRKFGANNVEAWVGRDLSKYLPGIYWRTVISTKHGNVLDRPPFLDVKNSQVTSFESQYVLLRAFKDSHAWEQYAQAIDEWCADHASVFSLIRIQTELDNAKDILSLSSLLAQWR